MAYALLGVHANAALNGLPEAIARWKPSLLVVLDHSDVWREVKAASPKTMIVGRLVMPSEPGFGDPSLDPRRAARLHCDALLPAARRMGATYDFWQGVNEPIIESAEAMKRFAEFEIERMRILHANGFRAALGAFSVGNPADMRLWGQFIPALEAARQYRGVLALHEYAWPTLDRDSPWYLLRHRKVYGGEPGQGWGGFPAHLKRMPLLITECGLDGGIGNLGALGWKARYAQDMGSYLQQLAWYDAELRKDAYVVGAALYCACNPGDPSWGSFSIWPEVAGVLEREARPIYRSTDLAKPRSKPLFPPRPVPQPAPRPTSQPMPQPGPAPGHVPTPEPTPQPATRVPVPQGGQLKPLAVSTSAPSADKYHQVLQRLDRILDLLQKETDGRVR